MKHGWEIKKLGDIVEIKNGKNQKLVETELGQYKILGSAGNVMGYSSEYICEAGTTIIGRKGNISKPIYINEKFWNVDTAFGLYPKNNFNPKFIYYLCLTVDFAKMNRGTTIPSLVKSEIKEINLKIPMSLPEQERIVSILDKAFSAINQAKQNAEKNLKNAKELFDSYLSGIFTNKGDDWEIKKLGEVCEFKSGTTISPLLEHDIGDIIYTKIADMNLPTNEVEINTSSRFVSSDEIKLNQIIPNGAVIFPKRGGAIATNKKRQIIKPTIVDLNTMAIIPSKQINNDYFFHWFQLFDLNAISNGANIPQINNYSFDNVYIPYPMSLIEQQAIVKKIDALSVKIKQLEVIYRQKLTELEDLKKSILQKAFNGELVA